MSTNCNSLQHTATHGNTLQQEAAAEKRRCFAEAALLAMHAEMEVALQHTATHCNTL